MNELTMRLLAVALLFAVPHVASGPATTVFEASSEMAEPHFGQVQ